MLHIPSCVLVTTARREFDTVVVTFRRLQRKRQPAARTQRGVRGIEHVLQLAEIHQRVGGEHDVVGTWMRLQITGKFGHFEFVVAATQACFLDHAARKIHTNQALRIVAQQRCAKTRATAGIQKWRSGRS